MRLLPAGIDGAYLVEIDPVIDERGLFARIFCEEIFRAQGLDFTLVQMNTSFTAARGTLRGMHFQEEPHAETKLIRCTMGAIFDVLIDLRRASPTRGRWVGFDLSATNRTTLYAPAGCAHGFLSLTDASEVLYLMGTRHEPGAARGARWNDPAFGIVWPFEPVVMTDRDRTWPDWTG
jgi:dTDP-4-dehydrorhamnose 3,5-epimerase